VHRLSGICVHKQNMALLKPPKPLKTREVYGTAYGMSDSDVSHVAAELESFFPENVIETFEVAGGAQGAWSARTSALKTN